MTDQANEKNRPAEKLNSDEKGISSASTGAAITNDQANKDHKEAKALAKPKSPSDLYRQLTGNECAEFKLIGDEGLLNTKRPPQPSKSNPIGPMKEQELEQLAKNDKLAESFLKELQHIKKTKGNLAPQEVEAALKNATRTFAPELLKLRSEKSPELEKHQEMTTQQRSELHGITDAAVRMAKANYGSFAVGFLNIQENEPGRAIAAATIGPLATMMLGPVESERLGKRIMLFGIAPLKGAYDEAIRQGTQYPAELFAKGVCNFAAGMAINFILTKLPPKAALAAFGVATTAVVVDQFLAPENVLRNQKLLDINSQVDHMSTTDFLNSIDKAAHILGPDVFEGGFAIATGGPGLPGGKMVMDRFASKEIKATAEMLSIRLAQIGKDIFGKLSPTFVTSEGALAQELTSFMSSSEHEGFGGTSSGAPELHGEHQPIKMFKEQQLANDEGWTKPTGKDNYKLEKDLLGHNEKPPPPLYEEAMANEKCRPSDQFAKTIFSELKKTVLEGEANFLRGSETRILPVKDMKSLGEYLYPKKNLEPLEKAVKEAANDAEKTLEEKRLKNAIFDNAENEGKRKGIESFKAMYDPNSNTIYVAEQTGAVKNGGMTLAFDLHHEIGHAIEQRASIGENSLGHSPAFARIVKEDLSHLTEQNGPDAVTNLWESLKIAEKSSNYRREEVFADMYAHVIRELLSSNQKLVPGAYSEILRKTFPKSFNYMKEMIMKGALKRIVE